MAVCAEGTWGVIEPAGAGGHPVPPERIPCPSSLGVLAVSPLHGVACPGTLLPHAFCTGQGLSITHPPFPGACLASSSPLLTAWHSPGSPFQSCSCGTAAQASACAAMTPSAESRCPLLPPAPDPSRSLPPSLSVTLAGPPGGCQGRSQLCITIQQPADTALLQHPAM